MSAFIFGTCVGLKSKDGVKDGKQIKKWQVGIAVPKPNGFEGETEIHAVSIGIDHQEAGLLQVYSQLKGKQIGVPVRTGAWSKADSRDATVFWMLEGDGQPRAFPNLQVLTLKPAAQAQG